MTVADSNVKDVYNGDGSTRAWPYTFPIDASGDIAIYVTDEDGVVTEITTNYSVDTATEEVTYPTVASGLDVLAATDKITLIREQAYEQDLDLLSQGAFNAETMEDALDKIVMLIQQLAELASRSIRYPVHDESLVIDPDEYIQEVTDLISEISAELAAMYEGAHTWDLLQTFTLGVAIGSNWTVTENAVTGDLEFKKNGVISKSFQ